MFSPARIKLYVWLSLARQILIVVTGGAVRLTASGLGCPTWPKCTEDSITNVPEQGIHGFIEFANRLLTFVLILIAALEATSGTNNWLWGLGIAYIIGRLAHGLGMDGGSLGKGRMVGTLITMLTLLGLAAYCISIPYTSAGQIQPASEVDLSVSETVPAN